MTLTMLSKHITHINSFNLRSAVVTIHPVIQVRNESPEKFLPKDTQLFGVQQRLASGRCGSIVHALRQHVRGGQIKRTQIERDS